MMSYRLRSLAICTAALIVAGAGSATAVITDAPAPAKPSKIKVETFAQGLDHPWGMQFLPDGRLLVTERLGRMRLISKDGKLSPPILEGLPEVTAVGQGGLLDVLLSPDFATSHVIYLSYGEPREEGKNGTSVARAKLVRRRRCAARGCEGHLQAAAGGGSGHHFGSRLVWAKDGTLFITTGERNVLRAEAQNPANDIGKVIRINADGSIPADNPKLAGWAPEVWSIGHRNMQGAALRPETGNSTPSSMARRVAMS